MVWGSKDASIPMVFTIVFLMVSGGCIFEAPGREGCVLNFFLVHFLLTWKLAAGIGRCQLESSARMEGVGQDRENDQRSAAKSTCLQQMKTPQRLSPPVSFTLCSIEITFFRTGAD